ncbi:MAG: hypothetical protein RSB77_01215 [Bacilli bacterium]
MYDETIKNLKTKDITELKNLLNKIEECLKLLEEKDEVNEK